MTKTLWLRDLRNINISQCISHSESLCSLNKLNLLEPASDKCALQPQLSALEGSSWLLIKIINNASYPINIPSCQNS